MSHQKCWNKLSDTAVTKYCYRLREMAKNLAKKGSPVACVVDGQVGPGVDLRPCGVIFGQDSNLNRAP